MMPSKCRLKDFCTKLDILDYNWILSNSDLKGKDENDVFFDDLYSDFTISRVDARRSINANPSEKLFGRYLNRLSFPFQSFLRNKKTTAIPNIRIAS
jgi:DNA adenine methylase